MLEDPIDFGVLTNSPTKISIEKLIGEELSIKLSRDLGGRRLYIAASPGENSPLAACIGLEAATKIGKVYAGYEYDIPTKEGKIAKILALKMAGVPKARISGMMNMSLRNVRRIINSREDDTQMKLFD